MSGWKNDLRRAIGLGGALAAVFFAGCGKNPDLAPSGQVLRISQRNEPADLDPATAALPDEFFIIRALSEGLVTPAPDLGEPRPAAATRWEVSADGLTYTFHLRPDGRWSNGEPVTADDFVASYRRVLAPATAAPKASLLFMVRGARDFHRGELTDFAGVGFHAVDPLTLVVTLERPLPGFLRYVASGPWIPVNARTVAKLDRNWTRPGKFVGNGAFTLVEWRPHQRIVVRRNPAFPDAEHTRLQEIRFLAFDHGDAEERAFRAGQLDLTMSVPLAKIEPYRAEHPAEIHRALLAETRYLAFNTKRPPFTDPRVRRALSLALDRRRLVEKVMHGGQQPAFRFLAPSLRAAGDLVPSFGNSGKEDAATARALLAAAGFPGGQGFPRLELTSWATSGPLLEAIQAMWKRELGIDLGLVTREAKVHLAALREGGYDIALVSAIPDVPDAANVLGEFVTDSPGNYPHWSDAAYDGLIEAAGRETTAAARAAKLRAAEERLLAAQPLAPLYFNSTNWLMRPAVQGWHQDPLWTRFYQDLSLDEKP